MARLEYPLGPDCPCLKLAGAEVPQWLRAFGFYEKVKPAIAKLKTASAGDLTVCGEFYAEASDLRFLFCFDCHGAAGHRIEASGFVVMPQGEFMTGSVRIAVQMFANEQMERVAQAGGTTVVINQG